MLVSALAFAAAVAPAPAAISPSELARFGIECLPRERIIKGSWSALQNEMSAARDLQDWPRYLAATQKISSIACQTPFWDALALGFAKTGKPALALEAAEREFDRDPNSFDKAIEPPHGRLRDLVLLSSFPESAVNKRLAALRTARERRIATAKSRLDDLPASQRPPERMVIKQACPGECCQLGTWTLREAHATHDSAGGAALDDVLPSGSIVEAFESEVHTVTEPVLVGAPARDPDHAVMFRPGDLVFRLDAEGEGFVNFWFDGKVVMVEASRLEARCLIVDEECWGDYLRSPSSVWDQPWWVRVRTADGRTTWIRPKDQIEGKCGCC